MLTQRGFGLEIIERQVHKILFDQLNDEIDVQEELWYEEDEEYQMLTETEIGRVTLEHIEPKNFYAGHRPSLLKATYDNFPNICVMCYSAGMDEQTEFIDQMQNWTIDIVLELMVRSDDSEEELNRRTHRTIEAVNQVMMRNESLNKYSIGYNFDPEVAISNTFLQSEQTTHGEDWWWAAARMVYNINRHSILPTGA